MKKNKINVRSLVTKYQANCGRIEEIADLCEKEVRERNEAEEAEYRELCRENDILRMKMQAIDTPSPVETKSADTMLRELVNVAHPLSKATITLERSTTVDLMKSSDLADTGLIPVDEQEMLKPLRAGLIWDKVGLKVASGLVAGKLRWPKHTKASASFVDEGERVADSKINFDALNCTPRRLACAIPVTREELESTQGIVESVIREEMPAAVVDLINEALFTTSKTVTVGSTTTTRVVYGPFVKAAENPFNFTAEIPTRKELLKMKSAISKAGIPLTNACWVMTEDMKAELEDVKVDAGSGRFLCENDHILGLPVFCTTAIGAGNVGLGEWSYQAGGFFGTTTMLVDPYTLARQNSTDFVLNAHFATVTLRDEAFVLGHKKVTE